MVKENIILDSNDALTNIVSKMATPFAINATGDAAAATQGAPVTSTTGHGHHDGHDEPQQAPTNKTHDSSITEGNDSPADTLGKGQSNEDDEDGAEMRRRSSVVQALARSYSRASGAPGGNPFFAGEDSPLNPHSDKFDGKLWAKSIVELVNQDGADFRSTGVCFQHMNVHGYGEATDYQADVANVWLGLGGLARKITGGGRQRIDILRDFDGLVRNGEMLVVLGPPGAGCSTMLKTISGEMNGIYLDEDAYFNYQGKCLPKWFDYVPDLARIATRTPRDLSHQPGVTRV